MSSSATAVASALVRVRVRVYDKGYGIPLSTRHHPLLPKTLKNVFYYCCGGRETALYLQSSATVDSVLVRVRVRVRVI